jgi:methyl-accepting chemotaxis protein
MTTPSESSAIAQHKVPSIRIDLAERLAFFDHDSTLAADAHLVMDAIAGRESAVNDAFWDHYAKTQASPPASAPEVAAIRQSGKLYIEAKFGFATDQRWVDMAADHAKRAYYSGTSITLVLSCFEASHQKTLELVREKYAEDRELLRRAVGAIMRMAMLDAEIMSATVAALTAREMEKGRAERADVFRERIATELTSASDLGTHLRGQAADASDATRGMLGKTSEVAAAAEQSAVAMRDAAHTAAGLIRAIEEARGEVEVAADIATRASEQAADAVKVSQVLSDTAKSIESILGLIRDVAGQTNLLALNATIEAARAGDAGRGFAVVAQEVKSLANQTARATDDIASKIAAIQSATQSTVSTNDSIRATVAEVQQSATRIRKAMETQAQTVTMITAAVDETALAADTMSSTIASIRSDTETVATEIDELESGFDSVNRKLAMLQDAAGDYVRLVA